jgi:hypothetical protein
MRVELFLRFPDAATALEIGRALSGKPEITVLPPDGRLAGTYFNICALNGDGSLWVNDAQVPGYHVIGLWHGPAETLPAEVAAFQTTDELGVRFG